MSYTLDKLKEARGALLQGDQLEVMSVLNHLIERMELIRKPRENFNSHIQQEIDYEPNNRETETGQAEVPG